MTPTESIKIDGKEYPFHFGVGALKLFGMKTDKGDIKLVDLGDVMQDAKLNELDTLLWCGLKSGGAKADQPFDGGIEEVEQMLEDDPYALDLAMDIINEIKDEYEEDIEGNEPKTKGKK